ncbi:MAG: hypothetical protein U1G07_27515 [Verrucomicrobiota bacterium]
MAEPRVGGLAPLCQAWFVAPRIMLCILRAGDLAATFPGNVIAAYWRLAVRLVVTRFALAYEELHPHPGFLFRRGRQVTRAAEDILVADFEGSDYGAWTTTGQAFGSGPAQGTLPGQMQRAAVAGQGISQLLHRW